jgi:hypothetical protein
MSSRIQKSFFRLKTSCSSQTLIRKVKREEVDDSTVLDVTEVWASDILNVNCAMYHSGPTCTRATHTATQAGWNNLCIGGVASSDEAGHDAGWPGLPCGCPAVAVR